MYAGVSTRQQSTDRQEADLLATDVRRDDLNSILALATSQSRSGRYAGKGCVWNGHKMSSS